MCGDLMRRNAWPMYAPDVRFGLGWTQLHQDPIRPSDDEFYSVLAGGIEVARAHLDLRPMHLTSWPTAPEHRPVIRLQLIEVAADLRGRGLGRTLVNRLQARHHGVGLAAISIQGATGFWEAMGWDRFEHCIDGGRLPLYLAPNPARTLIR